jgi:hypothetical protein
MNNSKLNRSLTSALPYVTRFASGALAAKFMEIILDDIEPMTFIPHGAP